MLLLVAGATLVIGGLLLRFDLFHEVPRIVRVPLMAVVAITLGVMIAVLPVVLR